MNVFQKSYEKVLVPTNTTSNHGQKLKEQLTRYISTRQFMDDAAHLRCNKDDFLDLRKGLNYSRERWDDVFPSDWPLIGYPGKKSAVPFIPGDGRDVCNNITKYLAGAQTPRTHISLTAAGVPMGVQHDLIKVTLGIATNMLLLEHSWSPAMVVKQRDGIGAFKVSMLGRVSQFAPLMHPQISQYLVQATKRQVGVKGNPIRAVYACASYLLTELARSYVILRDMITANPEFFSDRGLTNVSRSTSALLTLSLHYAMCRYNPEDRGYWGLISKRTGLPFVHFNP